MPWTIVADGLVAALLVATLVFVRRLSQKLEAIRAGRTEFEKLVADFARTTDQASSHLHTFKAVADNSLRDLQAGIERAQGLSGEFGRIGDDLKLLTERAEGAADRLDGSVGRARFLTATVAAKPAAAPVVGFHEHAAMRANARDRLLQDDDAPSAKLGAISGMR